MTISPFAITLEQMHRFTEYHMNAGHGDHVMTLDQRGLQYLQPGVHTDVQIGLPPREEAQGGGRIYLRAVF